MDAAEALEELVEIGLGLFFRVVFRHVDDGVESRVVRKLTDVDSSCRNLLVLHAGQDV